MKTFWRSERKRSIKTTLGLRIIGPFNRTEGDNSQTQ